MIFGGSIVHFLRLQFKKMHSNGVGWETENIGKDRILKAFGLVELTQGI